jgi:hypothetical protein
MSKKKSVVTTEQETAKAIYERLAQDRKPYITRAEDCAKYTIPSLFPKEEDDKNTKYETPWQSVGARGVNNLASKLLLALMPPNSPFFRLSIREDVLNSLETKPDVKQNVEQALVQIEQKVQKYIETHQIRVTIHEALKQLIVAGNCLLFLPPREGGIKLYRLNNYVIQRDAIGTMLRMVAVDKFTFATLPQDVQRLITEETKPDSEITIYTLVWLEDNQYHSIQEVNGIPIPGYDQTYPIDKCPWIPLRMVKIDGENYGRSYAEEYLGDLKSLEGLQKAIHDMAVISATVIYLVNPNGITQVRKLVNTKNGGFCPGREEDITCLQLDKLNDLQIAKSTADAIEARLSYIFMLNSAVQRQGERVTAEEIRYVAGELEDTLGGTYSILSQELQLPLVRRLLIQMQALKQIPEMPDKTVEPAITTGLEAIGRGHDLNKLSTFVQYIGQLPEAAQMVHEDTLLLAIATSLGIDTTGLIKTPEEIQQEQQQAQMSQLAQGVAPQIAKGAMDGMNASATTNGEEQTTNNG